MSTVKPPSHPSSAYGDQMTPRLAGKFQLPSCSQAVGPKLQNFEVVGPELSDVCATAQLVDVSSGPII